MKELVEVITKALVDDPEGVVVTEKWKENYYRLKCVWQILTWEK